MKKETKKHFTGEQPVNILVRNLAELPQKKHDNGYYTVSDCWGSCFFRVANNKQKFEIKAYQTDRTIYRTYTKIPAAALNDCYHVVLNWIASEKINFCVHNLATKDFRVIGVHDPIKHVSKEYYTQSVLIYSPIAPPEIEELKSFFDGFVVKNKEGLYVAATSLFKFDCTFIDKLY